MGGKGGAAPALLFVPYRRKLVPDVLPAPQSCSRCGFFRPVFKQIGNESLLESGLFLSGGLKLHTRQTLPIDRCSIAPGGGSGIPAVCSGGEKKPFLGIPCKELRATERPRPNLLGCCSVSLSPPPLSFPFLFFFFSLFCSVPRRHLQRSQHFGGQRAGFSLPKVALPCVF